MEFNDYLDNLSDDTIPIDPIPVDSASGEPIPMDPVEPAAAETPAADHSCDSTDPESAESGFYRNTGAGRKESPFENSPYETSFDRAPEAPIHDAAPSSTAHQKVRRTKERRIRPGMGRRIAAVAAAVALVIGSCAVTAGLVNRRWEDRTKLMEQNFQNQLNQLQTQIAQSGNTGISVSGTATNGGLSTTQVYAQNVNSVVAVSNYTTVTDRWGTTTGGTVLAGTGSGFIISEDGYVITNHHVVEGAEKLTVTTHMGEEYTAALVGSDEINDVALLKLDADGLDPVEIGRSSDLMVGDMVIAIGNPLGELTATATVGYVSGKDRSVSTDGTLINMLQTDAAINSGNSGGPLFNMKGQVIGITTAKYSGSSSSGASIEGIGFAIPIDDVMGMIEDFKSYGYLRGQAYLGVVVMNMDSSTAGMYSLPVGPYVQSVAEGGSAEKAGILPQDIIIAVGDYPVDSNATLTSVLRRFSAGDSTTITVFRSGAEVELPITFDERPQDVSIESTEPMEDGEMPETGSFEEWFEYFNRYFGNRGN